MFSCCLSWQESKVGVDTMRTEKEIRAKLLEIRKKRIELSHASAYTEARYLNKEYKLLKWILKEEEKEI